MGDDAIDALWDDFHPKGPRPRPFPKGAHVDPIKGFEGLVFSATPHLVLAWSPAALHMVISKLQAMVPRRATFTRLTSHLPCMVYGDEHWQTIQRDLGKLFENGRQAFIGTMNTFVIDTFFFKSEDDVRDRILLQPVTGVLRRLTPRQASRFFQAYQAGIEHVSEILRTEMIW